MAKKSFNYKSIFYLHILGIYWLIDQFIWDSLWTAYVLYITAYVYKSLKSPYENQQHLIQTKQIHELLLAESLVVAYSALIYSKWIVTFPGFSPARLILPMILNRISID